MINPYILSAAIIALLGGCNLGTVEAEAPTLEENIPLSIAAFSDNIANDSGTRTIQQIEGSNSAPVLDRQGRPSSQLTSLIPETPTNQPASVIPTPTYSQPIPAHLNPLQRYAQFDAQQRRSAALLRLANNPQQFLIVQTTGR